MFLGFSANTSYFSGHMDRLSLAPRTCQLARAASVLLFQQEINPLLYELFIQIVAFCLHDVSHDVRNTHTHTHTRNKTTRTDNERQTHAHKNKRHTHNRQLNALFHANFQVKFNNSVQPITVSVFVDLIDLLYCRIR